MANPEFLNRTESIRTAVPDMNNSVNSSRFNPQIYDTDQRTKLHPAGKAPQGSRHYTAAPRSPIVLTFNVPLSVIRARISNVPGAIPCPHGFRYAAVERAVRFVGNPPYPALAFHPCERYAPSTAVCAFSHEDGGATPGRVPPLRGSPCPALLSVIVSNSAYES